MDKIVTQMKTCFNVSKCFSSFVASITINSELSDIDESCCLLDRFAYINKNCSSFIKAVMERTLFRYLSNLRKRTLPPRASSVEKRLQKLALQALTKYKWSRKAKGAFFREQFIPHRKRPLTGTNRWPICNGPLNYALRLNNETMRLAGGSLQGKCAWLCSDFAVINLFCIFGPDLPREL